MSTQWFVHLLFVINVAHPAIGSALDVLGPVRKHTRTGSVELERIRDSIIFGLRIQSSTKLVFLTSKRQSTPWKVMYT
jgi:hypothetical protein